MSAYNFAPAAPDEPIVHGACRPEHPVRSPPGSSVSDWIEFVRARGIERVCCLLEADRLEQYDDLLGTYRGAFGPENVCHAPIPDFARVDYGTLSSTILPFIAESDARDMPVLVHCSAGMGRTGHVLALWLVIGRGYSLDDAIEAVEGTGRRPLEGANRDQLAELVTKVRG